MITASHSSGGPSSSFTRQPALLANPLKAALLAASVVPSRPTTTYARQAGEELVRDFGFKKLRGSDPRRAPVGAVVVYGGGDAGHVELRTERGFVSDFFSPTPYPRPVLGIYVKQS